MIPSSCKRTKHSFTALDSFCESVGGTRSQKLGGVVRRMREREKGGEERGGGKGEGRGRGREGGGRILTGSIVKHALSQSKLQPHLRNWW